MRMPVVLITGAATRVGAGLSRYFANAGYKVALHYHSNAAQAAVIAAACPDRCHVFQADLRQPHAAVALFTDVITHFGSCDVLIHNASSFENVSFFELDAATLPAEFALNIFTPIALNKLFAQFHAEQTDTPSSPTIIHMIDARITAVRCDHFGYTLTQQTLAAATMMQAQALAPTIRVNALCPGPVFAAADNPSQFTQVCINTPLKKSVVIDDICNGLDFLIGNTAVTGQLLFIDNGQHMQNHANLD